MMLSCSFVENKQTYLVDFNIDDSIVAEAQKLAKFIKTMKQYGTDHPELHNSLRLNVGNLIELHLDDDGNAVAHQLDFTSNFGNFISDGKVAIANIDLLATNLYQSYINVSKYALMKIAKDKVLLN